MSCSWCNSLSFEGIHGVNLAANPFLIVSLQLTFWCWGRPGFKLCSH